MVIDPSLLYNVQLLKYGEALIRSIYYGASLDGFTVIKSGLYYVDNVIRNGPILLTIKDKYNGGYIKKLSLQDAHKFLGAIHHIGSIMTVKLFENKSTGLSDPSVRGLIDFNNYICGIIPFVRNKFMQFDLDKLSIINCLLVLLNHPIKKWKNALNSYQFKDAVLHVHGIEPTPNYLQIIHDDNPSMKDLVKSLIMSNHALVKPAPKIRSPAPTRNNPSSKDSKLSRGRNKKALFAALRARLELKHYSTKLWRNNHGDAPCILYHMARGGCTHKNCTFSHICVCGEPHPFSSCIVENK